jgi:hypothetical protein
MAREEYTRAAGRQVELPSALEVAPRRVQIRDVSKRRPLPPSARAARRAEAREAESLARDRTRLALLERGGSAEDPIEVESASVVELRAASLPCPRCGGEARVDAHDAVERDGRPLRAVRTRCKQCNQARTVWFSIAERLAN